MARCRAREGAEWPGIPHGAAFADASVEEQLREPVAAAEEVDSAKAAPLSAPLPKPTAIQVLESPVFELLALAPPASPGGRQSFFPGSRMLDLPAQHDALALRSQPAAGVDPLVTRCLAAQASAPRADPHAVHVQYVTLEDAWTYTVSCLAPRRPSNVSYVTLTDVAALGAAVALGGHASSPLPLRTLRRATRRAAERASAALDSALGAARAAMPVQLALERRSALRWSFSCRAAAARRSPGETLERDLALFG
ncbi:hypothetical protein QBZ16_002706 [Prototheca wickerhamii]|uniref:Uncharacterized protein n=1 Tax=Prototheca wickerhamii TaxID=3111 RepID=A0AAD9IJV8_PROWI|nr:hypothetical protein QBZ16_002706 [Prototheca wickerhamii]